MADREELENRVLQAGREVSTAAVLFHAAVAAKVGLSATEEKTVDVLMRLGPLTARRIAAETRLAPASVTGLIDRLERKGFARRVPNPQDGRSVLVEAVPEGQAAFVPYFVDFVERLQVLMGRYDDGELAAIGDFMSRAAQAQMESFALLNEAGE